ncbi:unnamed protein product, partial [Prorocentrum cordatum]
EEIGRGSYGIVRAAVHRSTGRRCAIKSIPKSKVGQHYFDYNSLPNWRSLRYNVQGEEHHPNLVRCVDGLIAPTMRYCVMEHLCGEGSGPSSEDGADHPVVLPGRDEADALRARAPAHVRRGAPGREG